MVSINTSTSFLGASKSDETSNDKDISGLENIFASMLSTIDAKTSPLGGSDSSEDSNNVMLLLDQIKKKLELNQKGATVEAEGSNAGRLLSANILQIYQTYKSVIEDAFEVTNDSTIAFDIEKVLEPSLIQRDIAAVGSKTAISETEFLATELDDVLKMSSAIDLDGGLEEFSELELQKIKALMKSETQLSVQIDKNNKSTKPESKSTQLSSVQKLSDNSEIKAQISKGKITPLLDQNSADANRLSQSQDTIKFESLIESIQSSTKFGANKLISSDPNLQSNQSAYQAQLKLLEKSWGKELAKIIEKAIVSGKEKIDISLDPQKLGKMHLTLSVINNQTSISINTESASASIILNGAEDRLAQMFESSGYKLSNFQANANGNNNSGKNGSDPKQPKQTKAVETNSEVIHSAEQVNKIDYSIDGRKIINIIA